MLVSRPDFLGVLDGVCGPCTIKPYFSKLFTFFSELTGAEIKSLPEETRLYESVGRMFMLSSRSEITGK
jgi:hypothetical protein